MRRFLAFVLTGEERRPTAGRGFIPADAPATIQRAAVVGAETPALEILREDTALERRFQPVRWTSRDVDAILMLRGPRSAYEAAHGVLICDEALVARGAPPSVKPSLSSSSSRSRSGSRTSA